MLVEPINDDAKQDGTERAALSEANGWALAVLILTTNPHGKQRAIIPGLYGAQHMAMHPQTLK